MKTKLLFLSLISILTTISLYAQDKEAEKLLAKVSKTYKSFNNVKTNFTFNIKVPDTDINEDQEGMVYLSGKNYKLKLNGQEIICDGTTLWTYLVEENEVQISNYEPDESSITPDQIFTIYEEDFIYRLAEEVTMQGKVLKVVELTPNDKSKPYFKIKLFVDERNSRIEHAKIFDKNGNRYTYSIQNMESNINLSGDFFTFKTSEHKGINVVDLR